MKAALPIQADKVALRSSDGVAAVARSIISVVRPELLEIDTQKNLAFAASNCLIDIAKTQHPGYSFAVHSGVRDVRSPVPGTIASLIDGDHRIDIAVSDPKLIRERPTIEITFSEEGAKKAAEFCRTGRSQVWTAGEFTKIGGNIPLIPREEVTPSQTLTAISNLSHLPPKLIRLEIGSSNPVVFPVMEMRLARAGTSEAEVVMEHSSAPLKLCFVFATDGPPNLEFTFLWDFTGYSCSACMKAVDAIDRLMKGDTLRFYDLETNNLAFENPAKSSPIGENPLPPQLRRVLSVAAEIEARFRITVKFHNGLTEQDAESLLYLDCLLNERDYGANVSAVVNLTKQESELSSHLIWFLSGRPISLFVAPSNYPGFFPLFGTNIPAPSWGLYTEQCVVQDSDLAMTTYKQAAIGQRLAFKVIAKTPTFVRWTADCEALMGYARR